MSVNGKNWLFQSSGNAEQDEATAEDIIRTEARLEDNVCPNGCAQMNFLNDHERECPVCHFSQWSNVALQRPISDA